MIFFLYVQTIYKFQKWNENLIWYDLGDYKDISGISSPVD